MTNDLLTRLEQAEGPSRELDDAIQMSLGYTIQNGLQMDPPVRHPEKMIWVRPDGSSVGWAHGADAFPPHYTSSIDAALTLVPGGWSADLYIYPTGTANCELRQWPPPCDRAGVIDAPSAALAICIASLKARMG